MTTWAKYLIGLALALPMGAYVAGSLMASAADDPVNREPVRIQDTQGESSRDGGGRGTRPSDEPTRKLPRPSEASTDDTDDDIPDVQTDDDNDDDKVDDNGVRVVTPQPTRLDDGDDDDAGDDNGTDRSDGDDDDDDDESRDD